MFKIETYYRKIDMTTDRLPQQQFLLFLFTGNYYRSRFAEFLFNALVDHTALSWVAFSRGLATERGVNNIGPLSQHARHALRARGITLPNPLSFPKQLQRQDLQAADHIIALKEAEHRPLLDNKFADWPNSIEFWHVDDLDQTPADTALTAIEGEIHKLLSRLTFGSKH
jgi:protein-tyrosine phosphatase